MRIALLLIISAILTACTSPVDQGRDAYQRGDYITAERLWRLAADKGDPIAQYDIGVMWENGRMAAASSDMHLAAEWYLRSAKQGYTPAMVALGRLQLRAGQRPSAIGLLTIAARWNDQNARAMLNSMGEKVPDPDLFARRQAQEDQATDEMLQQADWERLGYTATCLAAGGRC